MEVQTDSPMPAASVEQLKKWFQARLQVEDIRINNTTITATCPQSAEETSTEESAEAAATVEPAPEEINLPEEN